MVQVRRGGRHRHRMKTTDKSTALDLVGSAVGIPRGRRDHAPAFGLVLPRKMDELVERGLFVRDENVEGGFRITDKGRKLLRELG